MVKWGGPTYQKKKWMVRNDRSNKQTIKTHLDFFQQSCTQQRNTTFMLETECHVCSSSPHHTIGESGEGEAGMTHRPVWGGGEPVSLRPPHRRRRRRPRRPSRLPPAGGGAATSWRRAVAWHGEGGQQTAETNEKKDVGIILWSYLVSILILCFD